MPEETEFAETFQDAQEDLERQEKNAKKRRTMMMWKNALDKQWKTRPIEATRKIIDRLPKISEQSLKLMVVERHTEHCTRGVRTSHMILIC